MAVNMWIEVTCQEWSCFLFPLSGRYSQVWLYLREKKIMKLKENCSEIYSSNVKVSS